ncbi:PilZ domain-containing protein [Xanthobacteraceae bacterium A53D]
MAKRQIVHVSARSAAESGQVNRRKSKRFPTSQRAWIMNGGEKLCFCEVVDMSAGGAQIKVTRPDRFPAEFNLLILGETYMKTVPVSVCWRDGDRMGVVFCSQGVFA